MHAGPRRVQTTHFGWSSCWAADLGSIAADTNMVLQPRRLSLAMVAVMYGFHISGGQVCCLQCAECMRFSRAVEAFWKAFLFRLLLMFKQILHFRSGETVVRAFCIVSP